MKRLIWLCGLLVAGAIGAGCGVVGGLVSAYAPPKVPYPLSFCVESNPNETSGLVSTWKVPGVARPITVNTFAVLTELDLIAARYKETPEGPTIELEFDDHGRDVLNTITLDRDRYLVVSVSDQPIMAWYIKRRITDGKFVLFGYFTEEHAKEWLRVWDKQIRKNLAM
jgi:hypothetical protein